MRGLAPWRHTVAKLSSARSNVIHVENLLDGLTEAQHRAVTVPAVRLRILAGAGSGKTRVLTRRIAHGAQNQLLAPDHTLALTFTRKAAGELRDRLRQLGLRDSVSAGTFHAQAYAQLRARWADQGVRPPELLDRRGRLLFKVLPKSLSRADKLAIMAEIDWATARRITALTYPPAAERANRSVAATGSQIAEYLRAFEELKSKRRMVDFDDLLELCIRDMSDPDYARTRHWRFTHLFIDEFQDVNPLQFDLLRAWLGPESTLCAVGDANQAIYSWNGADAGYLERFDEYFPGAKTVELSDNFRSTPQILDAAARVLHSAGRLRPNRNDGPLPTVEPCDDESQEARAIARRVRDRHRPGSRWSRQAILVRTNAQTTMLAEALRNAKVPVAIKAGASLADNAAVDDRLRELAITPVPLATALTDLRVDARSENDDATREALDALANLAEDHVSMHPDSTSTDFVAWVRATLASNETSGDHDAVDVMTFHAAKGLEWPVVHLAGVEDGLVPIGRATTPEAAAEEVRLFYVAITRAQDELHCSWARSRRFGERTMQRQPSRLLDEMVVAGAGAKPITEVGRNTARIREIRERLGVTDPATATVDVRDHIRDWRRQAALSAGVPAYVVFGDRTIDALVTSQPRNHDELRAIPGLGPVKVARYGDQLLQLLTLE